MKIATAAYIGLGVACAAVLGLAIAAYSFHSSLERSVRQRENLHRIVLGIAELQIRTEEYLQRFETRPLHQWQSRDRIIEASLERIETPDEDTMLRLQALTRRQEEIRDTFRRLTQMTGAKADSSPVRLQRDFLNGRLFILFEEQLADATELRRASVAKDRNKLNTAIAAGVVISLILLVVLCIAAWKVRRNLSLPLTRVLGATRTIGTGDLDYRIGTAPDNEIGDLSRAFDSMAEQLKLMTASRDQLEQTQDALKELNESLEERVAQRSLELEQLHDELRQVQKMGAIGRLSGGIAHDFNNLLAGMSANLELMRFRLAQQQFSEMPGYIDASLSIVDRAAALTHRLLAFSRQQRLEPKPIDINHLIGSLEELVRRTVGPEIKVSSRLAAGLPFVSSDISQLENVLINLAVNARDAMPNGGHLTFATALIVLDQIDAKKLGISSGNFIGIDVHDTGVGMNAEVVARAFDPFFTTKPIGQGTGLGLSMAYGFLKQSKGSIQIDSAPGRGTTIRLLLPATTELPAHNSAHQAVVPRAKMLADMAVLVVDDEPSVRIAITQMMQLQNIKIHEASSAAEGMVIVQSGCPLDLVISDIGLSGGMNGYEFAQAVRRQYQDLPILLITGYPQDVLEDVEFFPNDMALLTKPFMFADLWEKIHSLISPGDPDQFNAIVQTR